MTSISNSGCGSITGSPTFRALGNSQVEATQPYDLVILLLGRYPRETLTQVSKEIYRDFHGPIVWRSNNNGKLPVRYGGMSKEKSMHFGIMKLYVGIKMHELDLYVSTWINLKSTMVMWKEQVAKGNLRCDTIYVKCKSTQNASTF